jgi:hypothetical protein
MTDDFSTEMSDKIREIDNLRAAQRAMTPEERALSETWHDPLLWALMLEIVRKISLLGSEGLQNEFHFDPKDGTLGPTGLITSLCRFKDSSGSITLDVMIFVRVLVLIVERFSMLGITEKDVGRCQKIIKYMMVSQDMLVNSIEIRSPDIQGEDPEGSSISNGISKSFQQCILNLEVSEWSR